MYNTDIELGMGYIVLGIMVVAMLGCLVFLAIMLF